MPGENFIKRQPQTEEEKKLWEKAWEYEETYFEDFTLKPDSILHDYLCFQVQDDSGNYFETNYDLPDMNIYSNNYIIQVADLDGGFNGECNTESRIITITPKHIDRPEVLLHEMIHAYLDLFDKNRIAGIKEYLLLHLYSDLKTKISDLDKRILSHAHMISQEVFDSLNTHGILFFLKSLELDIRLNLPLGSVCSYGRDSTGEEI